MRNYWLDRIRKREEEKRKEEEGAKKGKFLYPPQIWKLVTRRLKKRATQGP